MSRTCTGVVLDMTDPCQFGNGGCTHRCLSGESGVAECACNPGYDLQADGRTYRDECALGEDRCYGEAVQCVNEIGTYRCHCQPGYLLTGDSLSCKGIYLFIYIYIYIIYLLVMNFKYFRQNKLQITKLKS
ncbi:unnamed protein product [Protopolystoma xenopodis]|uniref:EGF-like domain-containing protein n=1 Tax=Protopolystoma xenopodis TaxID=117903 RepID=A0A3S5BV36_9PLAT|nr:unnamed protein product [Protopolystoma xenopodis]